MSENVCEICGQELIPAPAKFDGEATFVGYLPHTCKPLTKEEGEKSEDKLFQLCEYRRKVIDKQILELGKQDAEIERLKELIEEAHYRGYHADGTRDESWISFKSENNIT